VEPIGIGACAEVVSPKSHAFGAYVKDLRVKSRSPPMSWGLCPAGVFNLQSSHTLQLLYMFRLKTFRAFIAAHIPVQYWATLWETKR
jgi:hypothetical protein